MARYIDADVLIKNIVAIEDLRQLSLKTVGIAISATPTADVVEVKHGRWIMGLDEAEFSYGVCSECEYREWDAFAYGQDREPNYCPNCGAKMEGMVWEDA